MEVKIGISKFVLKFEFKKYLHQKLVEFVYNLIENKNKKLISLEGKTHTSIIWSAGSHINSWLEDYYQTR